MPSSEWTGIADLGEVGQQQLVSFELTLDRLQAFVGRGPRRAHECHEAALTGEDGPNGHNLGAGGFAVAARGSIGLDAAGAITRASSRMLSAWSLERFLVNRSGKYVRQKNSGSAKAFALRSGRRLAAAPQYLGRFRSRRRCVPAPALFQLRSLLHGRRIVRPRIWLAAPIAAGVIDRPPLFSALRPLAGSYAVRWPARRRSGANRAVCRRRR
jgi:hypothetical protein